MKPTLSFLLIISMNLFGMVHAQQVSLQLIDENITSPVSMTNAGDGSNRLFICEQSGQIRIIQNGILQAKPFLDLRKKIIPQDNGYSERGLLGLAFHPLFKSNGKFYVYYCAVTSAKKSDHKNVIAAYTVSSQNPNMADPTSERIIIEIDQPESNHTGGQIAFGKDGYLYIGTGDGGGAGDEHGKIGNGQNINTLLGKILRIDVNTKTGYTIPADNPFVNRVGRDEIWAVGLRNPWKFSFDPITSRLFCADVGQDKWEEIDIIEKGKNYGWRITEGKHCYQPEKACHSAGLVQPIYEYSHEEGKCIIGGYVYRGTAKSMVGKYIFADWTGKMYALMENANHTWTKEDISFNSANLFINSFGVDELGEIYVLALSDIGPDIPKGMVFKLNFR